MEEQEEEENHHGCDEREGYLGSHLVVHAVEPAELHGDALRDVRCLEVFLYCLDGSRLAFAELHVGADDDDLPAVDAGERGRLPFRIDRGHLTDGHHHAGHGGRDEGVGDVLVGGVRVDVVGVEVHRYHIIPLTERGEPQAVHLPGQRKVHQGAVHAQAHGFFAVKFERDGRSEPVGVGVNPLEHIEPGHIGLHGVRNCLNLPVVFAEDLDLDRRGHALIVHLLDMDYGLGEIMLVLVLTFLEEFLRGAVGLCVHYELRDVLARKNRGIGAVEARRARADEFCDGGDAAVLPQHRGERVGDLGGLVKAGRRVEIDLDGKDRAGGHRHELDVHPREHQQSEGDGGDSGENREGRVPEALVLHEVVAPLKTVEQDILESGDDVLRTFLLGCLYEPDLQRGNDKHGVGERGHQREGDYPWECGYEIAEVAGNYAGHREEHGAYGESRHEHRREELLGTGSGRIERRRPAAKVVHVAVHRDDGVIHNHSEHDDERRERDGVQADAEHIHKGDGDGRADRHAGGCNQRRAHREEHEHHEDDHKHGDDEVAQERPHGVAHNLRLVGDARDFQTVRSVLHKLGEHAVNLLSERDDVVVRTHLDGNDDGGVAVVGDERCRILDAAHDGGDVLQAERLPVGG